MTLFSQEGGAYQLSPKSLKIRYVKTLYTPVVPIPVYRRVEQENDYMLSSLWKRLHLVSEKKKDQNDPQEEWVDVLTWKPGRKIELISDPFRAGLICCLKLIQNDLSAGFWRIN